MSYPYASKTARSTSGRDEEIRLRNHEFLNNIRLVKRKAELVLPDGTVVKSASDDDRREFFLGMLLYTALKK